MDDERFDLLTKIRGDRARSRRAVVSVVAVGALGAVLELHDGEGVSAEKRKGAGCVKGACNSGERAGACFPLCAA